MIPYTKILLGLVPNAHSLSHETSLAPGVALIQAGFGKLCNRLNNNLAQSFENPSKNTLAYAILNYIRCHPVLGISSRGYSIVAERDAKDPCHGFVAHLRVHTGTTTGASPVADHFLTGGSWQLRLTEQNEKTACLALCHMLSQMVVRPVRKARQAMLVSFVALAALAFFVVGSLSPIGLFAIAAISFGVGVKRHQQIVQTCLAQAQEWTDLAYPPPARIEATHLG